jgi:hypothetical protein
MSSQIISRIPILTLISVLVLGVVVGAAISFGLFFGAIEKAVPWVDGSFHILLPLLAILGSAMLIVLPATVWAVRRFLVNARGTLDGVIERAGEAARAINDKDPSTATKNIEQALLEVAAWYAPIAARRWIVQTALALLVAFGGLIGTALLFRQTVILGQQTSLLSYQNGKLKEQTELLQEQNQKIDLQTITNEAQRRGTLTTELFQIMQIISAMDDTQELSAGVAARISAFSQSAVPYWTIELAENSKGTMMVRRASRRRSPERGQLLVGLATAGFKRAGRLRGIFDDADVRGTELNQASLFGTRMVRADFSNSKIYESDLMSIRATEIDFSGSEIRKSKLSEAGLSGANFSEATLDEVDFSVATLSNAIFRCRDLAANFFFANLESASFRGSTIDSRTDFRNANLMFANFDGVDLPQGMDFSGAIVGNSERADLLASQTGRESLPPGFPRGWSKPPWKHKIVENFGEFRLEMDHLPPPP